MLNIEKSNYNMDNIIINENNEEIKLIFTVIENTINTNIEQIYGDEIENIFKEIKNLFQNEDNVENIFKLAKKNIYDYCKKCLKKSILHYIYMDFIYNITPKISFNIWNKEIEKFLLEKK